MSKEEKDEVLSKEPDIAAYIRRYGGAFELLNNKWRYCLWLIDVSPVVIRNSNFIKSRIERCRSFREVKNHKSLSTPSLFGDIRQPKSDYLLIPRMSSHRRKYLPIGFISQETILADSSYGLPNATIYHFGILQSIMHNIWMRTLAGRLKSDYRYSNNIVYNNFPFPKNLTDKNRNTVESKAQKVLDIRDEFPDSSLADLYDPIAMPPKLFKAHQELDKAVDLCYSSKAFKNELSRIEFLFQLYNKYTAPLLSEKLRKKVRS